MKIPRANKLNMTTDDSASCERQTLMGEMPNHSGKRAMPWNLKEMVRDTGDYTE